MRCLPVVRYSLLLASVLFTACGTQASPDDAKAADAGSAAASSPASDSAAASSAVVATMHRVYDGFVKRDSAAVGDAVSTAGMLYVSDDAVMPVTSPEGTTAMVKSCAVKSYAMDSVQTKVPAPDLVVLAFKLTIGETSDGKKSPSPDNILSTWQRQGGKWRAVAFSATPVRGAK